MNLRSLRGTLTIALTAAFISLLALAGEAASQQPVEPPKPPAPSPAAPAKTAPTAIPLAGVAAQAAEVSNLLRTLNAKFAPSPEIERVRKQLAELAGQLDPELVETAKVLIAGWTPCASIY